MLLAAALIALSLQAAPASRPAADRPRMNLQIGLDRHGVPAVGFAVHRPGEPVQVQVAGVRVRGGGPVREDDRWHVGSVTKSMTAVLAATMVEDGLIAWDTTIGDVLPAEVLAGAQGGAADITLLDLLQQRSGLPNDLGPFYVFVGGESVQAQRLKVAEVVLAMPLGERTFVYNNANFVIAGAMLEAAGDATWEELIRERVFTPLGLTTAGFGAPPPAENPQGHTATGPAGTFDNFAVLGPAGTVHMSLPDLARYAAFHASDGGDLLRPGTMRRLHTPPEGSDYAAGLVVRDDGTLWHNGSNTAWYTAIVADPATGHGYAAATNIFEPEPVEYLVGTLREADAND